MSEQNPPEKRESNTARDTSRDDWMHLGKTQGQRTAESVAAMRMRLVPTQENKALSRYSGDVQVNIIAGLAKGTFERQATYPVMRSRLFQSIIAPTVPPPGAGYTPILVEIASGFSPNGLAIARRWPYAQIIEIDLPDVVREKQRRLKDGNIPVPPNMSWREADLGITPLVQVLDGLVADVVLAEGLMMYFSLEEQKQIAQYVSQCLKPGGLYIFDVGTQEAMDRIVKESGAAAMEFFIKQSGGFPGLFKTTGEIKALFTGAGYARVDVHIPSEVAEPLDDVPKPISDIALIVAARKGDLQTTIAPATVT